MSVPEFNILYVDDEDQNLVSFKASFRREYNIFTAKSGEDGLKLLGQQNIHLVISDQRMPNMTGVQFLEKVRNEFPDAIRIILTGFSDVAAIIEAINSGQVYRYITKPWEETELRMTIENSRYLFNLQNQNKKLLHELQQKVTEQEKILRIFMKYVPEHVVQKAVNQSEETIFEGELQHISVLFCDIRGFTPMSEVLAPKEVVNFLNTYYSLMTECIKRHNGVVNQFVGDEIFATFGTPVNYANNEENAVFCALEMMSKLECLNERYKPMLGYDIQVGIGINSGEVVAGNLGCEERIDFSVTGDTVNTGKRIEMITKDYPNTVLISESVYNKTFHLFRTEAFEPLHVKGKRDKIQVYRVVSKK